MLCFSVEVRGGCETTTGTRKYGPDRLDKDNRAPQSFSSEEGVRNVMELHPAFEDVNQDLAGDGGRAPLSFVSRRDKSVVRLLQLHNNVHPHSTKSEGQISFSFTPKGGVQILVKILLERQDVSFS